MKKAFEIIHEDEDIVVINKSANVLSIPDRFDPTIPNLRDILIQNCLLYTSPSPRDQRGSRMPSSA